MLIYESNNNKNVSTGSSHNNIENQSKCFLKLERIKLNYTIIALFIFLSPFKVFNSS